MASRGAEQDYSGFTALRSDIPTTLSPLSLTVLTQAPQWFEARETCCFSPPLTTCSLHPPRHSLYIVSPTYDLPSYQRFPISHHVSRLPFFANYDQPSLVWTNSWGSGSMCELSYPSCMSCAHRYRSVSHESYERSSSSDSDPPCRSEQ